MNDFAEIIAIVEGRTEQIFIERILAPYLSTKNIFIHATQITKPGAKGGDVKYERAAKDFSQHLKQRKDIYVTSFFDYYGLKQWPGLSRTTTLPYTDIPSVLTQAATEALTAQLPHIDVEARFIPFIMMHEFETLLFSDVRTLANALHCKTQLIQDILQEFTHPEAINNSKETAPSKRLNKLKGSQFKKTTEGIRLAESIGIDTMRKACNNFDQWLSRLEALIH